MKTGIIIQARTGSTRLPNKVTIPFYKNKGILELIVERIKESSNLPIVIATTTNPLDNKIFKLAAKKNISCYRGSENNVLDRFIKAAEKFNLSNIIRVCSDNPFIDIEDINVLSNENNFFDYSCFCINNSPSIISHLGFWAEKVSLKALKKIKNKTRKQFYLEHVTNYIYNNPENFKINKLEIENQFKVNNVRLTLDTIEDFKIQKKIFSSLLEKNNGYKFNKYDVLNYLNSNPIYFDKMIQNISTNEK
ncbi:MAG: glycosyl transferase family 2 [Crocinitomicaceae bacterium]|nr:glycosyl transferase family 2 [Crocinitomicaceae bacterium]